MVQAAVVSLCQVTKTIENYPSEPLTSSIFSKTLNWSQEKIQEWCDRQVAKWGYPLKIEN